MPAVGPLDVWSLNASHSRMLLAALAREAMKCYRIKEADAGFQLLTNDNVNVFPGFRNHGNTCWLNAILQCCMHTRPLRDEILREREVETSLQAALQRIALSYWALGNRLRHAVLAPIDALTALVLERPHLGGALQQDVGEAFPEFPLRAAAAFSPSNDSAGVMCEHVLLGKLGPH